MPLLGRKSEEEKEAKREQKEAEHAGQTAARQVEAERRSEHLATIPKWEYQVKRISEGKQKGLLGSQRMEQIFNGEGARKAGNWSRSRRSARPSNGQAS